MTQADGATHTLAELISLLTEAAKTFGYKELHCAAGVIPTLGDGIPPATPGLLGQPDMTLLTGVPIVGIESFGPGQFRLIHHDHCEVDTEKLEVHHDRCTVTAEGTVRLEPATAEG